MNNAKWIFDRFQESLPPEPERSVVTFGENHVRLPGSARSERFRASITPWNITPLECCDDGFTRMVTYVKPVQCGGSTVGEVAICKRIAKKIGGDIQYNWTNDEKAKDRWDKRIEKFLKACKPVAELIPSGSADRYKSQKCLIIFPHCNLIVQGAHNPDNLDSDSIAYQVNEEIHNWEPGHLAKAFKRGTAFWNSFVLNISNAGTKGDQLHQALDSGTKELWESKCPGCGLYHPMFTRAVKDKPGGLRYDSEGCKREDGTYNYNKLESTIYYEFPCCSYRLRDDVVERRRVSSEARYGKPTNDGAPLTNRSFTLEAVSVDYIPFVLLIKEKHEALRALKYGDPMPWKKYLQERECRFYDEQDRPLVGNIILRTDLKKDRAGLKDRAFRFFALDRQQGILAKGEFPHWWLVIRDVMENGDSLLVWEGKVTTEEDVIDILKRHGCQMHHGVADSGDDTTFVYKFCLRWGINCIKGDKQQFYAHEEGTKRIFSKEKPLHTMLGVPPRFDYVQAEDGSFMPDPREPFFSMYSKHGIRERLYYLRSSSEVKWEIPGDVSDDYKLHMDGESLEFKKLSDGSMVPEFHQKVDRIDLYVCECYVALLMDMAGLIGAGVINNDEQDDNERASID